ncbi:hypothetical protein [Nostocoides sp. HKS02]|uniref:hypothetical protein n=1 Tax=Nostocoides sp. HKS02 TaxID=1813880 RepID=UPI0012B4DFF8|nr:hypothetical protein [Tetrasphaera sp. HKS02]QGN58934.1 hypothetical protein GKE56_14705 [Tetrasphaera sp. HKS02]
MRQVSSRVGIIGLAAFLVIDVLLVVMALNSTRASVNGAALSPTVHTGGAQSTSGTGSTSPTATKTTSAPQPTVAVAPLAVGIAAVDQSTAIRFTVGSCAKAGSSVEVSTDGGSTWKTRPAPFDAVMRIRVRADKSTFAVGANQSSGCAPAIRQAPGLTKAWGDAVAATDVWFRDPQKPDTIGLAKGGTGTPCPGAKVIDLAVVDAGAGALCATGAVLVSTSGAQWNRAGMVPGALAVALDGKANPYAVLPGAGSCAGLAVVQPDSPGTVVGCVQVDLGSVRPGSVALSMSADSGWLRVGQRVFRADSSLATWKAA